ncbi:unnamed protein product (macronuclear) [Paramecium tetraurelia]|uniref:RING-Gid-type domain-containing protein n=1 Tax=Paramecium tetraurelia TaxID=5888 RepID=A0DYA3_PARTE|nr:uncharacterized protein GSPATT00002988001 [Paramecium tetraurelia]CAK88020.1 unnamed protein product [Paramecium tetraurelia]|eukprot:XP_001455417.1 hypothetical protein (macronuclear) [Paramecium tetraurelia strain d4-2]
MNSTQQEGSSLLKDLERIKKKTRISNKIINGQLDQIIAEIEEAKINNDFSQLKDKLQNQKPLTKIKQTYNECYAYFSKMGKNMDKLFKKNLQYGQEHVELDSRVLTELIKNHLLRDGEFEAYELLVKESGSEESHFHQFFAEIQTIVKDLKERKLESAILWAEKRHKRSPSNLLYELLKQRVIQLVQTEGINAAVNFMRNSDSFQEQAQGRLYEICLITYSVLLWPNLENTKYYYLYDDERNWPRILNLFLEVASKSQNILIKSEIRTVFSAGCLAMPKLIKYNQITRNRSSEVLTNDIPIDIEIGKDYKYHSFFVCPVSREVTNTDNPPVLLKCGHVISKLSAHKMIANKQKFKCPTCPVETKGADLPELIFI